MPTILASYGIALITFTLSNLIWLQLAAPELYRRGLPQYWSTHPSGLISFALAMLVVAGLVYFVIAPLQKSKQLPHGLLRAAIYGVVLYGSHNLVGLAYSTQWSPGLALIDVIWGGVVMVAVTAITVIVLQRLHLIK